ncbi:hypothetical protein CHU95_04625 [Niveispirillum lacus]|uniref:Uncharacterized protein n=1 Tax=Niveispirillum lacus TaxID=1981099 RepID=A0A255Z4U4_9PROT|nr:hypothetical protein [Niveispirillum lacus]OYQ36508.1 hypothetical protein CHU95_04625 [Niveispirillum lacus]
MTFDRLLVLLLSLSFLLLAPPAAAFDRVHAPVSSALSGQADPCPSPAPLPPADDTGLFLLTTVPEAPAPTGTEDSNGQDGLSLPKSATLPALLLAGMGPSSLEMVATCRGRASPWSTGPPSV